MRLRTILLSALLASLTGCRSLHRASADEYSRLASMPPGSTFASSYVGYSRDSHESKARVYLEVWRMGFFNSSSTDLYWTPLSDFPDEVAAVILGGHDPWSTVR